MSIAETKKRRHVVLIEHDEIYHKQYRDTVRICHKDTASADVLRVYEVRSNQRATELANRHNIADGYYPHEDDLWLDEISLRDIEEWTFENRGKSTYARVVADVSPDKKRPSLIQCGYLRTRYIARPYDDFDEPEPVPTTVYRDEQGPFIVVMNRNGTYIGDDGDLCCSRSQGYPLVTKQYRCEVDVIRAAIAKSAWREPPPPLPRWQPIVQRRDSAQKESAATAQETTKSLYAAGDAGKNDRKLSARMGTNHDIASATAMHSSALQHSTAVGNVSRGLAKNSLRITEPVEPLGKQAQLYSVSVDKLSLSRAQWTTETIIALSSFILDIPVRPDESDEEELERWLIDWYEPACWLIVATQDLDPRLAWERIQRQVMGMVKGPTWYARERAYAAPVTLRHVVGANKVTKLLSGHNWGSVKAELDRAQWYPNEVIAYSGPPLEIIEEPCEHTAQPGQVVVTEVSDDQAMLADELDQDEAMEMQGEAMRHTGPLEGTEAPLSDEALRGGDEGPTVAVRAVEPEPPLGMTYDEALALASRMSSEIPYLIIDGIGEASPGCYGVFIAASDNDGICVESVEQWYSPPGEIPAIDEAILYAYEKNCGGSSPPLQVEEDNDGQRVGSEDSSAPSIHEEIAVTMPAHRAGDANHYPGGVQAALCGNASG